jgi:hypothetical protein
MLSFVIDLSSCFLSLCVLASACRCGTYVQYIHSLYEHNGVPCRKSPPPESNMDRASCSRRHIPRRNGKVDTTHVCAHQFDGIAEVVVVEIHTIVGVVAFQAFLMSSPTKMAAAHHLDPVLDCGDRFDVRQKSHTGTTEKP